MKTNLLRRFSFSVAINVLATLLMTVRQLSAQSLTNGLVSYWPLDEVQGGKTPDLVSGYDMQLNNLTAADLTNGFRGQCFNFSNARRTLLSRVHSAAEDLPINKHPALTISLWANIVGQGQTDLRLFSEGNTGNSDPLFNIGTDSTGASGVVDYFFRQSGAPLVNHVKTSAAPLDGTWHHIVFVQQANGDRQAYIDGVLDSLAIPAKPLTQVLNLNDTTIGGILRASPSHWVSGLIDEVAVWKRDLTAAEINDIRTNGVPSIIRVPLPLEIRSFTADFPTVAQGDRVRLRWDASKDATLAIDQGVGNVTGSSVFGVGSTEVAVNQDTTYTLTATRGATSVTAQVRVRVVSGVAPGWRLIENFNFLNTGVVRGQGNWINPEGDFTVVEVGPNKVLGFDAGTDLAATRLNSLSLREGQSATMFFRLFVVDAASAVAVTFGLTERPIRFNGDFNGNVGPYLRADRAAGGMGPVDLQARNGVGGPYDTSVGALLPGRIYNVWIDVTNRTFDVGDLYSVYVQEDGAANRAPLFVDYVADRDAVNIDPALGAPGPDLISFYISALAVAQGVNTVLFDDLYLSANGYNATVPVPASVFRALKITSYSLDGFGFTLRWGALPGKTYTVRAAAAITGPWMPLVMNYPPGGATEAEVSYQDADANFETRRFYQVIENP